MGWLCVVTYSTYIYIHIYILYNSEVSYAHRIQTSRLQHDRDLSRRSSEAPIPGIENESLSEERFGMAGSFGMAVVIDQWGKLNN